MPAKRPLEEAELFEVSDVIDKKTYKGQVYYKLKWAIRSEPTWELAADCHCRRLIEKFEKVRKKRALEEDENEWEVEEILDKRISGKNNQVEYLLKWRNWPGKPTWEREELCSCINLIAAYENPKLRKLWNFQGNNPRLWLDRKPLLRYMRRYAREHAHRLNLIQFDPDMPEAEQQPNVVDGINAGPLSYKNHWYLVIVLVNHVCITRQVLVCDPLNTLMGVTNISAHPVFRRLRGLFDRSYPIKPIAMTPMERSDLCAFYVLAAFERALYLFRGGARFLANKLFFDTSKPEMIRCHLLPDSDGEISAALPVSIQYLGGPQCEFCDLHYESHEAVDEHIERRHFKQADVQRHNPSEISA